MCVSVFSPFTPNCLLRHLPAHLLWSDRSFAPDISAETGSNISSCRFKRSVNRFPDSWCVLYVNTLDATLIRGNLLEVAVKSAVTAVVFPTSAAPAAQQFTLFRAPHAHPAHLRLRTNLSQLQWNPRLWDHCHHWPTPQMRHRTYCNLCYESSARVSCILVYHQ